VLNVAYTLAVVLVLLIFALLAILFSCYSGAAHPKELGVMTPPTFRGKGGWGDKVNVENTKITENISISVSQLQIKQRN